MRKIKTSLAYLGLYLASASDSVRYSLGWYAWGTLVVLLTGTALVLLIKNQFMQTLKRIPFVMQGLFLWMLLSVSWSSYRTATLIGLAEVLLGTVFALFLVSLFSWRELLRLTANTMRFILVASLLFELYAAVVVRGGIYPLFRDFQDPNSDASAYYWTRGLLFKGERIQGIVGNANLLAYIAMLGLILFCVQYAIHQTKRSISLASITLAVACLVLARSAGVTLALAVVVLALLVLVLAEGKTQELRHQFYRVAYTITGISLFFIAIYSQQFFTFLGKSPDMTGRSDLWALVIKLIEQKPLAGWGWIGYWQPGVKPYDGLFVREGVTYYQAHDIFLDFAVQIGFIGLALLVATMVVTFIKLWRLAVRHSHPLYAWPLFIFLSLIAHNILESRLIIEIGWILFVVCVVKINEPSDLLEPDQPISKRAALGIFMKRLVGKGWSSYLSLE